ncbi:MAG: hypothetical protein RLZZ450_2262 [Pseudomonadota bacterium]|jgi:hypothetical protein
MFEMVYTISTKVLLDPLQLGDILASSRRNNPALGVSGILLYHQGSFMQLLEGEEPTVRELYTRIALDPRHHRIASLRERHIETRSFGSWSMGFVALDPRLLHDLPGRHALSSNGTLEHDAETVLPLLDQFRDRQHHRYIMT